MKPLSSAAGSCLNPQAERLPILRTLEWGGSESEKSGGSFVRQRWSESLHKVLVVDDESSMRFLLRMVFETEGFEVVEAHHGAAALERMKETEPDLVVTDLMMPVMNGRELIERLRADAETAGIPILVLSATANAEVAGADAALRKPFDIDALLATARSLSRKDAA